MRQSNYKIIFRGIIDKFASDNRSIDISKIPDSDIFLKLATKRNISTPYMLLVPHNCEACWKCIDSCPKAVIAKVNFLMHKHAKITNADACIGCLKCFNACVYNAIYKLSRKETL